MPPRALLGSTEPAGPALFGRYPLFGRYHYLVAIITALGTAPFTICKNRTGEPLTTWAATAGSLVLLRAPGLDGLDDRRPLHTVSGPATGHRISVSYRMDTTTR